ncbi:MAG TPA: alpha-glucan family phosphorylase [Steroidobacteraceae bacterium]|nr:alpha-glucan family phosphorylase [Steroidobacteraceae bacterium]HQR49014.1 alpha-glucan family phosphorylase [Steroidobacteraceae bacterium]
MLEKNEGIRSGAKDVRRAAQALAREIPARLAPLARVAYNYHWVWQPDGEQLFRAIDSYRWRLCRLNPVRFLDEAPEESLERAASDLSLVRRAEALRNSLEEDLARPALENGVASMERPIAFFCAEFGLHRSLPIYSGGLGVLAGDVLKEASDRGLPMVGVGLMYRQGFFHQRVDAGGWQHEYWTETDPERRACVLVTREDGSPLTVRVPIWDEEVSVNVWRVEVGRVPLFLLDAEVSGNSPRQRFVSARLYEGNRQIRLAQYALIGIGGMRVLDALGIDPSVIHMNEGHPVTATMELLGREKERGASFAEACEMVRRKVVFTTHTPVPAGNETYALDEMMTVFPGAARRLGGDMEKFLSLGRFQPTDRNEPINMTALAIRMSRSTNGVSKIHAGVARRMWQGLFPGRSAEEVPITQVTNGVHVPSWISPMMRRLLDQYLVPGWHTHERITDPATWAAVDRIPDAELWAVRQEYSRRLARWVRSRTVTDRLTRGDVMDYALKAANSFDGEALTLGFARRLATYKRLHLLFQDPGRMLSLLDAPRPIQVLIAGKAHPRDDDAKRVLSRMFNLKSDPRIGGRVAFLEDYHVGLASILTSGCGVWINLPRPPLEASGTSGIKAAFNGVLNLSVLDGWWAEAYDGSNGWAIDGGEDADTAAKDARDAAALFDLLEREVIPMYYDRDASGVPHAWVARIKASLRTIGPRFCATRMLDEYARGIYAAAQP